jgi:hypothetical protein
MSNPVMTALTLHKANELRERDRKIAATVSARLGPPPTHPDVPSVFRAWCEQKQVSALPARAGTVALFVLQATDISIAALCEIVAAISRAHANFADPTSSWMVRQAFVTIAGVIVPPRSWKGEDKRLFADLPWQTQRCIADREAHRETVLRKAQNEAAAARNERKKLESKNVHKDKTAAA